MERDLRSRFGRTLQLADLGFGWGRALKFPTQDLLFLSTSHVHLGEVLILTVSHILHELHCASGSATGVHQSTGELPHVWRQSVCDLEGKVYNSARCARFGCGPARRQGGWVADGVLIEMGRKPSLRDFASQMATEVPGLLAGSSAPNSNYLRGSNG